MEIMLAYMNGKKIICLFRKGTAISCMIQGLPKALLIEYASEKEIVEKLEEFLKK